MSRRKSTEDGIYGVQQAVKIDRFDHVTDNAFRRKRFDLVLMGRQDDHGHQVAPFDLPQFGNKKISIHPRHLHVKNNQIRPFLLDFFKPDVTVPGKEDLKSFRF